MKKLISLLLLLPLVGALSAQIPGSMEQIKLLKPNLNRGKNIMQSLQDRRSTREFAPTQLSLADLSDLLWAANGVNRPDGKRTAPSAMNRQEIEVYVCMATANYRYDAKQHMLIPLSKDDVRPLPAAPVNLVLVGPKDFALAPVDAGIVSQNISLFCSGVGLATVPRATHKQDVLKEALKLTDNQTVILNHPVGYFKVSKD